MHRQHNVQHTSLHTHKALINKFLRHCRRKSGGEIAVLIYKCWDRFSISGEYMTTRKKNYEILDNLIRNSFGCCIIKEIYAEQSEAKARRNLNQPSLSRTVMTKPSTTDARDKNILHTETEVCEFLEPSIIYSSRFDTF